MYIKSRLEVMHVLDPTFDDSVWKVKSFPGST